MGDAFLGLGHLRQHHEMLALEPQQPLLVDQRAAIDDVDRFLACDMAFHREIAAITGNPIFAATVEALFNWAAEYYHSIVRAPGAEELTLAEHQRIVDAIAARQPDDAAQAMRDHLLRANERWHGFGNLAPGFNMLDPIKATIITPGLDIHGDFSDKFGIPAAIVTKYLAEHGVIVEKTGLYSFFIMFTIGITKGRWNTMVAALQQFKDDYDKNQPLWRVLPEFAQKHPRYERMGLRDLCTQIHEVYKANDVARLTTEMYLSNMVPAMKPTDAFAKMAHREIDRVPIEELEGRITAVLLTPYPPGIPLLIPGERFNRVIINYLEFARDFNERFPGFETDVHGLVKQIVDGKAIYYVDCVAQ